MKAFGCFFMIIGFLLLCSVIVTCTILWYDFTSNCEDYLKLSGDAPTLEKAHGFLNQALDYIEKEDLTSGHTAFFFDKPDNDLEIWYTQIKGAAETTGTLLEKIESDPESVSQLVRDNALMKIREVVLDDASGSTTVTVPCHITWFPSQILILIWWIISGFMILVGIVSSMIGWHDD